MPHRIQRVQARGWRTPTCSCGCGKPAIHVGIPSVWENPFRPVIEGGTWWAQDENGVGYPTLWNSRRSAIAACMRLYREDVTQWSDKHLRLRELRGHNLMCWCALYEPCHADVLLEIANRGDA